jgi:hypothetical protein
VWIGVQKGPLISMVRTPALTAKILSVLFDRLYVLWNQLIHGGGTWNSSVNRSQVKDGAALLGVLLPVFIDILMDNPGHDWGRPYYHVV